MTKTCVEHVGPLKEKLDEEMIAPQMELRTLKRGTEPYGTQTLEEKDWCSVPKDWPTGASQYLWPWWGQRTTKKSWAAKSA